MPIRARPQSHLTPSGATSRVIELASAPRTGAASRSGGGTAEILQHGNGPSGAAGAHASETFLPGRFCTVGFVDGRGRLCQTRVGLADGSSEKDGAHFWVVEASARASVSR